MADHDIDVELAQSEVNRDYFSSFSTRDNGLLLMSSDGVKFRVHPFILQMASSIFNDMLNKATDSGEIVELQEDAETLTIIMDMIHPNSLPFSLHNYTFMSIWNLLIAAEKYEIIKVLEDFRFRLLSDSYFRERPIDSYVLACRFGWSEEISVTSTAALANIKKPMLWTYFSLTRLDVIHFIRLQRLASDRKELFARALRSFNFKKNLWNKPDLIGYDHSEFRLILYSLIELELENYSSGDTLRDSFWHGSRITSLLDSDGIDFIKEKVVSILDGLPTRADVSPPN